MAMNFFKRRRFLKKANLLELTPVRLHQHETEENGRVVLLVQKFKNKNLGQFMLGHRATHFRIKLDETGSAVWAAIDGETKVEDIISKLHASLKDETGNTDHLEERLAKFMSQLYDQRYITFQELNEHK
jgi:hypothetical protein